MDFVRFATDNLTIPAFLTNSKITPSKVELNNSIKISNDVRKTVGLHSIQSDTLKREIAAEWVVANEIENERELPIVLYLHGGFESCNTKEPTYS